MARLPPVHSSRALNKLDLLLRARSVDFAVNHALRRILPSYRYREGIRLRIVESLRGQGSARRPQNEEALANAARNRGSLIAPDALAFHGRIVPWPRVPDSSRWKVHRV